MDDTLLEIAANRYEIAPAQLTPLAGGHFNAVYEFTRGGQAYVLRITPPSEEMDARSAQSVLEWMHFLGEQGAAVTQPLHSRDGSLIELVEAEGGTFIITVFAKAKGVRAETLPFDAWNDALYCRLGSTVGKLHALAKVYVPPNPDLKRPDWDQIGSCFNPGGSLDLTSALIREKRREIWETIQGLPKDAESYGLIHTDLHCGNFFVDPDECAVTVFDFDDCAYGWFVMDIAMLLLDALVLSTQADREVFAQRFLLNFLQGYRLENRLSPFWIAQLPHFLKLLETGLYLMVSGEYDPSDRDSWIGKFMLDRRTRIENDLPFVSLDADILYSG